jgi:hypothetical protein
MRRWFLLPPKHCANTYLMRERLPSERHSKFDWGRPLDLDTYPKFRQAAGSEVIVTQVCQTCLHRSSPFDMSLRFH